MTRPVQAEALIKSGAAVMIAMAGAAKAQDFDGAYAGLSYSSGQGDILDNSNDRYSFDGHAGGAFVGYNFVTDGWLFGAEIAFSNGDYQSFNSGNPYMAAQDVRDIKARAGRVFGQVLAYGVVGRSSMDIIIGKPGDFEPGSASATVYGLGVEAKVGSRAFVGVEYLTRDLDLSSNVQSAADGGADLQTLTLRVGISF